MGEFVPLLRLILLVDLGRSGFSLELLPGRKASDLQTRSKAQTAELQSEVLIFAVAQFRSVKASKRQAKKAASQIGKYQELDTSPSLEELNPSNKIICSI
jgi:hypothetical protein